MRWNSDWIKQCFSLIAWSFLALSSVAAQQYAYIANNGDGTVSVIKTASYEVAATIPVAASPVALAVSPNGKQLYVASAQPEGKLSVVDLEAQAVIATLEIGLNPSAVAVSRDGARVYISNTGSNSVSVVDTVSLAVIAEIAVGESPRGLAVSPDGTRVYVANCLSQTVSTIGVEEGVESGQIAVGRCPVSVRLDASGQRAYVANSEDNSISTIDLAENQVAATLDAGNSPEEMTLSPDGSRLYVANTTGADFVSVFDTRSSTLLARIPVLQPRSLATSPEGGRLFVTSSETQSVTVVNAVTNETVGDFAAGAGPRGATATPPSAIASGMTGQILLGPGCPIYREGDTNCNPKPYQASIVLKNENRTAVVTQFNSDATGQFLISIAPGKYWVEMPDSLVRFPYVKPFQVTVPDSQYVPVTVYYDTGIR